MTTPVHSNGVYGSRLWERACQGCVSSANKTRFPGLLQDGRGGHRYWPQRPPVVRRSDSIGQGSQKDRPHPWEEFQVVSCVLSRVCVPDWVVRVNMKGPCEEVQKNEDQEGEAAATGPQAETLEAKRSWTADSHSTLETEGASSSPWGPDWTSHLRMFPRKWWEGSWNRMVPFCWGAFPSFSG